MNRRHPFQPEALGPLETRLALSHMSAVHVGAHAGMHDHAPDLHAMISSDPSGTSSSSTGHMRHSDHAGLGVKATKGSTVSGLTTYNLSGHNNSSDDHTSVMVSEHLPSSLMYVPGSAISSSGAMFSATSNSDGSTTLTWKLPELASHTGFTASFQAQTNK